MHVRRRSIRGDFRRYLAQPLGRCAPGLGRQGQFDVEGRSLVEFGFKVDASAQSIDEGAGNRQAQSDAAVLAGQGGVGLGEFLEDLVADLDGDAGTVVDD